jgi:uncharacterized protein YggE
MKTLHAFGALSLTALMASAPALAGSIVVIGQGSATAAPEFTRLHIEVTSICYDTSRAAKDANAILANQLVTLLKTFAATAPDKVTAVGGYNDRQTEYTIVGNQTKTLCELKWRATNTLTIEMAAIDRLPDLQDQVLTAIDAVAGIDPDKVAQTYAELGRPAFSLYPESTVKLRKEAQLKAYDDAKQQFDAFSSRCAFQGPQLTNISPPEYSYYASRDGAAIGADASTPIIPDEINVDARWRFEWSFTPAASCPQ